jgi:proteasome assembly chaperone (PAC2) family protein
MASVKYHTHPVLANPVLIMGFSGWANAGDVSVGAVDYLISHLDAHPLATLEPSGFFDMTEDRPTAVVENGLLIDLQPFRARFHYARTADGQPDIIIFRGAEPRLAWDEFCDLLFDLVDQMEVSSIFTLGGTYDYVPHWHPPIVSAVYSSEKAGELLAKTYENVRPAEYQGPISIHTYILQRGSQTGRPVIGLWGHAPVYIQTGNIKLHYAMVEILKNAAGFDLDTAGLFEGIEEMNHKIEELVAQNPNLQKYLEGLEEEETAPRRKTPQPHHRSDTNGAKVIPLDQFLNKDDNEDES